jgi:hypothetical protein
VRIAFAILLVPLIASAKPGLSTRDACDGEAGGGFVAPRRGETNQPLNAKIWIAGRGPGTYTLEANGAKLATFAITEADYNANGVDALTVFEPASLAPATRYTVQHGVDTLIDFTTGNKPDRTAPRAPKVTGLYLAVTDNGAELSFQAKTSEDTVFLEVKAGKAAAVIAPPAGAQLSTACGLPDLQAGAKICIEVRAIDVAGNRSAPSRVCGRSPSE